MLLLFHSICSTPHPSTIIKPPVIGHHTPPPPSATITKGILKSPGACFKFPSTFKSQGAYLQ